MAKLSEDNRRVILHQVTAEFNQELSQTISECAVRSTLDHVEIEADDLLEHLYYQLTTKFAHKHKVWKLCSPMNHVSNWIMQMAEWWKHHKYMGMQELISPSLCAGVDTLLRLDHPLSSTTYLSTVLIRFILSF